MLLMIGRTKTERAFKLEYSRGKKEKAQEQGQLHSADRSILPTLQEEQDVSAFKILILGEMCLVFHKILR